MPGPITFRGVRLGVPICEDIWGEDVVECLVEEGRRNLLVPNGSPYWRGKHDDRTAVAVARVSESGLPMIYQNPGGRARMTSFFDGRFLWSASWRAASPSRCRHLLKK